MKKFLNVTFELENTTVLEDVMALVDDEGLTFDEALAMLLEDGCISLDDLKIVSHKALDHGVEQ